MAGRVLLPAVSSRSARHFARSFNGSAQSTGGFESEALLRRNTFDSSVHYQSIYDSGEFTGSQRNRLEVMRKRLKSHFMTPYQKYKHRGRKPWKLLLQLLKLFMVTVQIVLFAKELFSVVNFLDDSEQAFKYLFLVNSNDTDYSIYTKNQFYFQVRHSVEQYYHIQDIAVGTFGYLESEDGIKPMNMCIYKYTNSLVEPEDESYNLTRKTSYSCQHLHKTNESDQNITYFIKRNKIPESFESVISIMLMAEVRSFHVRNPPRKLSCYKFNITIQFDNSNHDGKVPVTLNADGKVMDSAGHSTDNKEDYQASKTVQVFVDVLTILFCLMSVSLCSRSIYRQLQLVKATRRFFARELSDGLSVWDCLDLMNLWFILIVISDTCAIIGSLMKMLIDVNDNQHYTVCSMFLGIAVLLTWCGLLRYLGHFKKYNILLVTLKASAPSVLRFCVCGSLLYFGYLFCGWIVLGPYHIKVQLPLAKCYLGCHVMFLCSVA
ncbi:Mucolipin-2 [Desmophyllum pertusum]|uniref:Mucolipin-2 n=1 Tax=Desmophyllum pertusum TaxID=174260 RepID=A0A9W9ZPY0_9CNID|nr:Mucolipin-2 [Desmophyllum pertusum]